MESKGDGKGMLSFSKSMSLILLVVLVTSVLFAHVFLVHASGSIVRTQVVGYGFQNQYEEMTTTYTFGFDGSLNVKNTLGYQFVFPTPKFQPAFAPEVTLWENETHVAQHFFVSGPRTNPKGVTTIYTLDLTVFFDFSVLENGAKITLQGTTNDTDSEIEYEFENPRSASVSNTTTRYRIGNIYFDWADLEGATAFEFAENKLKVKFAAEFNLDPTIVSEGSESATSAPTQRKLHYAYNLWWAFYLEASLPRWRTSSSGGSWSTERYIDTSGSLTYGADFSVCFRDTTLDYIADSYYRRGTLDSLGTITWADVEKHITSEVYGVIAVDSNGYPYVSSGEASGAWVTKSSLNNGTWSTAGGYPLKLASLNGGTATSIVALNTNKMYVVYTNATSSVPAIFRGRLFNGSAWETEETITTSLSTLPLDFSLIAIGDDVHLVFIESANERLTYVKRDSATEWGSEVTLSTVQRSSPSISKASTDLYVHSYQASGSLLIQTKYDSTTSSWSEISSTAIESIDDSTLISAETANSLNEVGVLFTTEANNVKFAKFTTWPPEIEETETSSSTTPSEGKPPANQTVTEPVSPLPNLGLWGLIGAVGLIAVGGILAATGSSSSSSHGYRRSSSSRTRYSRPPRPRKTTYRKVKG